MELSKKTTILLTPELHARLAALARSEKTSIGELIRRAVVERYGLVGRGERLAAVAKLAELNLPVTDVARMKRESVPDASDLLR
jgi:hypothetical protein